MGVGVAAGDLEGGVALRDDGATAQYRQDLASPAGQELLRQLYESYLERPRNIFFWTEPIEG